VIPSWEMETPVLSRAFSMVDTVAIPFFDFMTAHAPVTCGVAIEVPDLNPYPVPHCDVWLKIEEQMLLPGARRSTIVA
jgi:hypothetical protein